MSDPAGRDDEAITALIHEYALRLDRGDLDGVAALFEHAELRSTRHDRVLRGATEARTLYLGLHPILAGEYRDRFARVDGRWAFTERVFDPRLFGDLSRHMRLA
jgi:hypothetical protein